MKFKIRYATQLVGLFVVAAVGFALVVLVALGTGQGWFEPTHTYYTTVSSAAGLSAGMSVEYKGFEIGRVRGYELTKEDNVKIEFFVRGQYLDLVDEDSVVELTGIPLVGGELLLHRGIAETEPIPDESFIPSWDSPEGRALREEGRVVVSRPDDALSRIIADIDPILERVPRLLDSTLELIAGADATLSTMEREVLAQLEGPIGELLSSSNQLVRRLDTTVAEAEATLANVERLSEDVAAAAATFRDPEGIIPQLLGPGSASMILEDEGQLYRRVDNLLAEMEDTMREVHTLTRFVGTQTPQIAGLLEEGREALELGHDVLLGVRNNPLVRGGIPERMPAPAPFEGERDARF